jgi:hypothetical protein
MGRCCRPAGQYTATLRGSQRSTNYVGALLLSLYLLPLSLSASFKVSLFFLCAGHGRGRLMVVGGVDQVLVVGSKMEHGDEPYLARKVVSSLRPGPLRAMPADKLASRL